MLTDMHCRTAPPKDKIYRLTDQGGLFLEIKPAGGKYWRYKYYFHGKEKRLYIGAYPDVSLSNARDKHRLARSQLKQNIDPSTSKREEKQLAKYSAGQTFELVGREWYENFKERWSESHQKNIIYRLEKDVFPQIGDYPIATLKPPNIVACLQKIEKNGSEMARRALQMCSQIFRYAVQTGRIEKNITADLKGVLKPANKGHYASIEVDELPKLVKALFSNEARLYKQTRLLLHMMLLTFVRTRELTEADWKEIDLKKAEWIIPAERMKMRKAHFVPLSDQAIEILKELKKLNGDKGYLFPSIINSKKPMSNNTILSALRQLGYGGRMTGHGFRALAMSAIKEKLGYRHEVIDRQLAHLPKSKVDQAYDRAQFPGERRQMMQQWADLINTLKEN